MPPTIRPSHTQHPRSIRRTITEVVQSFIQMALLLWILAALIGNYEIQQTSMEPNFHEGQRVIVNQLGSLLPELSDRSAYAATGSDQTSSVLRRGQVVVLYETPQRDHPPLIKRLIGLPGDTIEIRNGRVLVNGHYIDEPYVHGAFSGCTAYCGPLTLDDEEYFVIGDNRPISRDSRAFGPIPADQLVGPVVLRYWPPADFAFQP